MALCFAHSAAGYLAYEAVRPAGAHRPALLAAAIGLANGPDLDFLPGLLLGHPGAYHRGVTHTLLGVVAVAAAVGVGGRLLGRAAGRLAAFAAAVWSSHLVLDVFTADAVAPYGVRVFWPLSDAYWMAPVSVFGEIVCDMSGPAAFFRSLVQPATLRVWTEEVGIVLAAVAAVHLLRAARAWAVAVRVPEGS